MEIFKSYEEYIDAKRTNISFAFLQNKDIIKVKTPSLLQSEFSLNLKEKFKLGL